LCFEPPDTDRFPCLRLAREAGEEGGTAPVILNAANEVAVGALLAGRLRFVEIAGIIEKCLDQLPTQRLDSLEKALNVDREARRIAASFCA
jgi:1-deoxy-D-xylulose-5-phosphate reductoisomerase